MPGQGVIANTQAHSPRRTPEQRTASIEEEVERYEAHNAYSAPGHRSRHGGGVRLATTSNTPIRYTDPSASRQHHRVPTP